MKGDADRKCKRRKERGSGRKKKEADTLKHAQKSVWGITVCQLSASALKGIHQKRTSLKIKGVTSDKLG